MVLTGQKIILRPAIPEDRRQIFEWLTGSDLTSKMLGPPLFADNEVPAWEDFLADYNGQFFDDANPDGGRSFIIEAFGERVGHINYNEIDRKKNTVELDIWLRSSSQCNKGYGTDAINTLCAYLSSQLGCCRVMLAPSARNKAAIRAYQKCGFAETAEVPDNFVPDYTDTVVMIKTIK